MRETEGVAVQIFAPYEARTKPKREAKALREKEQEAPGQRSPGTSGVQGVFQERESFYEENF